jgi:hypothetical protein
MRSQAADRFEAPRTSRNDLVGFVNSISPQMAQIGTGDRIFDRPVHLDRVGRWLARRQPEVQVRGRILESCATDRGSYTSAPMASGPKYSIWGGTR